MRRLILSALIAAIPMLLAATGSRTDFVNPQNPYSALYEKNVAGLSGCRKPTAVNAIGSTPSTIRAHPRPPDIVPSYSITDALRGSG